MFFLENFNVAGSQMEVIFRQSEHCCFYIFSSIFVFIFQDMLFPSMSITCGFEGLVFNYRVSLP